MRLPLLLLVSAISALYGCSAVNVEGKDPHARFPEGEVTIALNKADQDSPKRRVNTISAGYSRTTGHDQQTLSSGDYIDINNSRILGPATIDNDVRLGIGYLRFVQHNAINNELEWIWGAGLGYQSFYYTGTSAIERLSFSDRSVGLHGLIGMSYYFTNYLGIEGDLGGYLFNEDNSAWLYASQVRLTLKPVEALRIYAGYRRWSYQISPKESDSNIDFLLSGPTAGIVLSF